MQRKTVSVKLLALLIIGILIQAFEIESVSAPFVVRLGSREESGTRRNIGIIKIDSHTYTLPNSAIRLVGTYTATYIPEESNIFVRWETSGSIRLAHATSRVTSFTMNGSGTITAVFASHSSTDLNGDREINMQDVTIVAIAFGSELGDSSWNQLADLDKNGVVNIIDITFVAKDYGKSL